MLETTPTSLLEAVNSMLNEIGEAPVSTLENNGVIYAVSALSTLSMINRAVQSRGWHWNTEINFPITPSYPEGYINLPKNTLRVDAIDGLDIDVAQRGNRLYDRANHTFVFGQTLYVDLTLLLDFESLPEAARHYITVRASRKFQEVTVGSDTLAKFSERDEDEAKVALEDAEADTADLNILDNISVREVLDR